MSKYRKAGALIVGTALAIEMAAVPAAATEAGEPKVAGLQLESIEPQDAPSKDTDLMPIKPWDAKPGDTRGNGIMEVPKNESDAELIRPTLSVPIDSHTPAGKAEEPQADESMPADPTVKAEEKKTEEKKRDGLKFSILGDGGVQLPGVSLVIYELDQDAHGNPKVANWFNKPNSKVANWFSRDTAVDHPIDKNKPYIVSVVSEPEGYEKPDNIVFKRSESGDVSYWKEGKWVSTTDKEVKVQHKKIMVPSTSSEAPKPETMTTTTSAMPVEPSDSSTSSTSSMASTSPSSSAKPTTQPMPQKPEKGSSGSSMMTGKKSPFLALAGIGVFAGIIGLLRMIFKF